MLAAFDLGSWGGLSDGPVANGRLGSIWGLDAESGSWAIKQVGDISGEVLAELREGAAFQEAALAAGVPTPAVRRTLAGEHIADCRGCESGFTAWVDLHDPLDDSTSHAVSGGKVMVGGSSQTARGRTHATVWTCAYRQAFVPDAGLIKRARLGSGDIGPTATSGRPWTVEERRSIS